MQLFTELLRFTNPLYTSRQILETVIRKILGIEAFLVQNLTLLLVPHVKHHIMAVATGRVAHGCSVIPRTNYYNAVLRLLANAITIQKQGTQEGSLCGRLSQVQLRATAGVSQAVAIAQSQQVRRRRDARGKGNQAKDSSTSPISFGS